MDPTDPGEEDEYDPDDRHVSDRPEDTAKAWRHILRLCRRQSPIGHGPLDSFLSGPDSEARIELVERECATNEWLRLELRDTLTMNQPEWTTEQRARLIQAAGLS
jgi:hypothetical protein